MPVLDSDLIDEMYPEARAIILAADPFDLILHMEQVFDFANPWRPNTLPAGPARTALYNSGAFRAVAPQVNVAEWDHLGYAFALENTRIVQIARRILHAFRSGEGLGLPSVATQRWLDTTETLLFGAGNPVAGWLSTSTVRPDAEAVRRNAYWRMFGMDLAFGTDANSIYKYDKSEAANRNFSMLFAELLHELWKAIENIRNIAGPNPTDDERIYRLALDIQGMLTSRRRNNLLAREELSAATALGWLELTFCADTPIVVDLRAQAADPASRLRLAGERVGLMPHSRAVSFFAMASSLSRLLRTIEAGFVTDASTSWLLYRTNLPPLPAGDPPLPDGAAPIGSDVQRVIAEWAAASGKDLKARALPVQVQAWSRPALNA
jgi:hypothetical protein